MIRIRIITWLLLVVNFIVCCSAAAEPGATGKAPDIITSSDVRSWGARGDGVTSDTSPFKQFLDSVVPNGTARIGKGSYRLNWDKTGTSLLTISQGMALEMSGEAFLAIDPSVPNTVDGILVQGTGAIVRGVYFNGLRMQSVGKASLRDYLVFNIASNHEIINASVKNSLIGGNASTGYAIKITNDASNPSSNGLAFLEIYNNHLYGGMSLTDIGDTCKISFNEIKGSNYGIHISQVRPRYDGNGKIIPPVYGYSAQTNIDNNNIVSDAGGIFAENMWKFSINENNIEQNFLASNTKIANDLNYALIVKNSGHTLPGGASIYNNKIGAGELSNNGGILFDSVSDADVQGNSIYISRIGYLPATGRAYGIKLKNHSHNNTIRDNKIYISMSGTGISIDHTSLKTIVNNNSFMQGSLQPYETDPQHPIFIEDYGKETIGTTRYIIDSRRNSTYYVKGQMVAHSDDNTMLLCLISGTSAGSIPDYASKRVGDTVVDGSTTWKILSIAGSVPNMAYFKAAFGYFAPGFQNADGMSQRLMVMKDSNNMVTITGHITKHGFNTITSGEVIAHLGDAYKPSQTSYFQLSSGNNSGTAQMVHALNNRPENGQVLTTSSVSGVGGGFSINHSYLSKMDFVMLGTTTSNIAQGATSFPLSSTSGLNTGDIIGIPFINWIGYGPPRFYSTVVTSVSPSNVTVLDPVPGMIPKGVYLSVYRAVNY